MCFSIKKKYQYTIIPGFAQLITGNRGDEDFKSGRFRKWSGVKEKV